MTFSGGVLITLFFQILSPPFIFEVDCPISDSSPSNYVYMPQKMLDNFAGTYNVKKLKKNKENGNTNIDWLPHEILHLQEVARSTRTPENPIAVGSIEQMKDPHSLKRTLDVSSSCDGDSTQVVKHHKAPVSVTHSGLVVEVVTQSRWDQWVSYDGIAGDLVVLVQLELSTVFLRL